MSSSFDSLKPPFLIRRLEFCPSSGSFYFFCSWDFLGKLNAFASIPYRLSLSSQMEHMVYFYAELGLANYATIMYSPSMLAASSVYAARCALNKCPVWDETLKSHTGFLEAQLL